MRPLVHGGLDAVALMMVALDRSQTIRDIVSELDRSDVVVWIEIRETPSGMNSCLRLMGTAGGIRRLHIAISPWHDNTDRLKLLGHELWHAVEISRAIEVRDEKSLEALFLRIGDRAAGGLSHYETAAAIEAGRAVLSDLRKWGAHHNAEARRPSR